MFAPSAFYTGVTNPDMEHIEPEFFKDPEAETFSPVDDPRNNTTSNVIHKGGFQNNASRFDAGNENAFVDGKKFCDPFSNSKPLFRNARNPFVNRGNNPMNDRFDCGKNGFNTFNTSNNLQSNFTPRSPFSNNSTIKAIRADRKLNIYANSDSDSSSTAHRNRIDRDSASSTYIDSGEEEKLTQFNLKGGPIRSSLKVNGLSLSTPESLSTQRLVISKKQMLMRSYFSSFKLLSLLALILFFCPLISILLDISCISNDGFCYPLFEIQTSGKVENQNRLNPFEIFEMKSIGKSTIGKKFTEDTYRVAENFLSGLSLMILDNPFNSEHVRETLDANLDSTNTEVTYKFANFGYCKEVVDLRDVTFEDDDLTDMQCHLMLGHGGTDVPSVLVKDLAFHLSEEEIEGDPEYVSGLFQDAYRNFYKGFNLKTMKATKYLMYGFSSIILSQGNSYLALFELVFDIASVVLCVIVSSYFKSQGNKSLLSFKNYLFDVNMKQQFSIEEQEHKFSLVQVLLIFAASFVWISCVLKIGCLVSTSLYASQIHQTLSEMEFAVFEGIKVASAGAIVELLNIGIHLIVGIGLVTCIISKPWVVKVDI
jgi:hypothetical protein